MAKRWFLRSAFLFSIPTSWSTIASSFYLSSLGSKSMIPDIKTPRCTTMDASSKNVLPFLTVTFKLFVGLFTFITIWQFKNNRRTHVHCVNFKVTTQCMKSKRKIYDENSKTNWSQLTCDPCGCQGLWQVCLITDCNRRPWDHAHRYELITAYETTKIRWWRLFLAVKEMIQVLQWEVWRDFLCKPYATCQAPIFITPFNLTRT